MGSKFKYTGLVTLLLLKSECKNYVGTPSLVLPLLCSRPTCLLRILEVVACMSYTTSETQTSDSVLDGEESVSIDTVRMREEKVRDYLQIRNRSEELIDYCARKVKKGRH